MIDSKIMLHCTDKGVDVEAYIISFNRGKFLEASVQTVKVKMPFDPRHSQYVGNMAGYEFVIKDCDIVDNDFKPFKRSR